MRSLLLLASLVAYAAATGRPLGNRLAELVHQDPLNEEKIDKMLSLIDDAEERSFAFHGSNSGKGAITKASQASIENWAWRSANRFTAKKIKFGVKALRRLVSACPWPLTGQLRKAKSAFVTCAEPPPPASATRSLG